MQHGEEDGRASEDISPTAGHPTVPPTAPTVPPTAHTATTRLTNRTPQDGHHRTNPTHLAGLHLTNPTAAATTHHTSLIVTHLTSLTVPTARLTHTVVDTVMEEVTPTEALTVTGTAVTLRTNRTVIPLTNRIPLDGLHRTNLTLLAGRHLTNLTHLAGLPLTKVTEVDGGKSYQIVLFVFKPEFLKGY